MSQFSEKLKELGFKNYNEYLYSSHWKQFRDLFLKNRKKCVGCGKKRKLVIHHLTYIRLGNEEEFDVIAICFKCHELVHKLIKENKFQLKDSVNILKRKFGRKIKKIRHKVKETPTGFKILRPNKIKSNYIDYPMAMAIKKQNDEIEFNKKRLERRKSGV